MRGTTTTAAINGTNAATGTDSVILGGDSNTITDSTYSNIIGGSGHTVSNSYSAVVGGANNKVSGKYSISLGGQNNESRGDSSILAGGEDNIVKCPSSFICGIGNTLKNENDEGFTTFSESDLQARFVCGRYNDDTLTHSNRIKLFMVGNGTSNTSKGNAFSIDETGFAHLRQGMLVGNADFAEYFESAPEHSSQLEPGVVVELSDKGFVRPCANPEYAIGVVFLKLLVL